MSGDVEAEESGCTCGGMAACQQCQDRDAAMAPTQAHLLGPDGFTRLAGDTAYTDADAWHDNYDGMAARWIECDVERLALKERLADAEMRLRLLSEQAPSGDLGVEVRSGHSVPDVNNENRAVGAEVAVVLGAERCKDIHSTRWDFKYGVGICLACESWGQHAADALEPLIAERVEAAKAEALREAADEWDVTWNRGHDRSVHPFSHLLRERAAALNPEATS